MIGIFDKNHVLKITASMSIEDIYLQDGDYALELDKPLPQKPVVDATANLVFDGNLWDWVDLYGKQEKTAIKWTLIRAERDRCLLACDWTQLPDVPLATKEIWAVYRQALRDITEQEDPFNIQWPSLP